MDLKIVFEKNWDKNCFNHYKCGIKPYDYSILKIDILERMISIRFRNEMITSIKKTGFDEIDDYPDSYILFLYSIQDSIEFFMNSKLFAENIIDEFCRTMYMYVSAGDIKISDVYFMVENLHILYESEDFHKLPYVDEIDETDYWAINIIEKHLKLLINNRTNF